MSLRTFHLLFILLAMVGADLFGLWSVSHYLQTRDGGVLALGAVALLGGLGLLAYGVRMVRKLDHLATR